jgi:opacity protein-like surface antigen
MMIFKASLRNHKAKVTVGAVLGALLSATSAFAQTPANCNYAQTGGAFVVPNLSTLAAPAGAAGAALAGAIGNVNTIFLTQQGSAFVSAPPNPTPNQPGGGVWVRGVGGEATVTSTSSSTGIVTNPTAPGGVVATTATNCNNRVHESFGGVQAGADIARLNWNGWNMHVGTTAGYVGARTSDNNGFNNNFEVPFVGTYFVATKGRFFADVMVRQEFYNVSLNNVGLNYFNQPIGAHGVSIAAAAGYNFDLGQGWFIEPSGGFIYANTKVDSFTNPGTAALAIPGTISTNDVVSEIGRLSVRAGKTIETQNIIWQPFASASLFHEFAGNVTTNYSTLPNSSFNACCVGPSPYNQTTQTSRVGTYGQYSLGIAGQVVGTGWLGFARVDYRDGANITGWTGNAGVRYQFTPEMIASVMPVKVKAPRAFIAPTNWTGFYVGGFGGAAYGRTEIGYNDPARASGTRPWVFGGLGGIEGGYNYQLANRWVLGVEGDIAATNINGARTAGPNSGLAITGLNNGQFTSAFYVAQDRSNWLATATGRVGYAYERTLYYVKGGAAFEDGSVSTNCVYGTPAGVPIGGGAFRTCNNTAGVVTAGFTTPRYTRAGWTLGFGTEFDLGHNWSAKGEYDYIRFGSHSAVASDGTTVVTDRADLSVVKVGVNYKFVPGAVVAKY